MDVLLKNYKFSQLTINNIVQSK